MKRINWNLKYIYPQKLEKIKQHTHVKRTRACDVNLLYKCIITVYLCLYFELSDIYRCNSFIVDLHHKFTVRNMNEIPVFVQPSELSNIT